MIIKTLKDIAQILQSANIPYMVIGAQAVVIYGKPRFSEDIDITVALTPDEFRKIKDILTEKFDILPADVEKFVHDTWVMPVKHKETMVRVDIVFSITPFEREAINKAKDIIIEGVPVKYIPPEYLIVQKIIAGRTKDLEDAQGIIDVWGNKTDIAEIERIMKSFGKDEKGKEWFKRWRKLKRNFKNE